MRCNGFTDVLVGGTQVLAATLTAPFRRRWYNRWGRHWRRGHETDAGPMSWCPTPCSATPGRSRSRRRRSSWPWVVQMGQGRGGLYSFDGLENLVGCDIRSADRILPSPQQLGVGDLIRPGSARLPVLPRRPGHARRRWSSWGPTRARRTPPRRRTPRPNTRPGSGSLRPIPDTRERDWSPANACPIRLRRRHVTWSNRSDCHGTPDASRNQATRRARPPPKQGSSDRHACGDTRGLKREVCPCEWDGTKSH